MQKGIMEMVRVHMNQRTEQGQKALGQPLLPGLALKHKHSRHAELTQQGRPDF